jgi:hypothetical protein
VARLASMAMVNVPQNADQRGNSLSASDGRLAGFLPDAFSARRILMLKPPGILVRNSADRKIRYS